MDNPEQPLWRVVHAKAVGTSHLSSGKPCQDAVNWRLLPSGLLAAVLADGAGSAPQSETGANLAVAEALSSLANSSANQTPDDMHAWGDGILQAFQAAIERLLAEAHTANLAPNAFATTLTCLVASDNWLVLGQIGDGLVIARTPDGDLYTLSQAQRGEYANETVFLTMPNALEQAYFQVVELDLAGLAVMSDGLLRLAVQLPDYTPHNPFFAPLWTFAAQTESGEDANQKLADFLASERVCNRTDDDKSLLLAVRPNLTFSNQAAEPVSTSQKNEG